VEYYRTQANALPPRLLREVVGQVLTSPYLGVNNLNRDFVATKGFSIVFRRSSLAQVERKFPYLRAYLAQALDTTCNAFYLNPLVLTQGSRVDPHIDRSLRSYCKIIQPPQSVSVLYAQVPGDLVGGELVLSHRKRLAGRIQPVENLLVHFQGDLTHGVSAVLSPGQRISIVCEQYQLLPEELEEIPALTLESRNL